jgi:hypothetical protein
MMTKKRKMTKRQILTALIENQEKKEKLDESYARLGVREDKLHEQKKNLKAELRERITEERKKMGVGDIGLPDPIIYKGKVFTFVQSRTWGEEPKLDIEDATILK